MYGHDEQTERYFDQNTPTYSLGRYEAVVSFLRQDAAADATLLDIGCGAGNVLALIAANTAIGDVAGLDVSPAYLEKCSRAVAGCQTCLGSIIDPGLQAAVQRRFTYVLVGAVLHHLVGRSRAESLALAQLGLRNAWSLVEPGGALIIMEPTFRPHWAMSAVFYVKRLVSRVTSKRVAILGYWNNLGEPVVSYFSHNELSYQLSRLPKSALAGEHKRAKRLTLLLRFAGVKQRADSVLIVRKVGE